ncbi:MAG: flagellar biosynthesis protein FlhA [Planctomycetota bacterium]|jgi:flagellar biosynthesis protein FlhA
MPEFVAQLKDYGEKLLRGRDAMVAFFLVGVLGIMIVPLNPMLMDVLLIINITFSLMLLLTTVYVNRPLEFSAFPSLLLIATLYRLSLNIATTRLILGNAQEKGAYAAGHIVYAFSSFVAGGQGASAKGIAIGATIFLIIVIIQFVVITKGATRISEVAARFTMDAMPGHQMAIDADLNAGLIDESEAKVRREDLRRQTDFYGSMDGASKFVRGDAIAGIIITIINILVGFIVGSVMYGMSIGEAAEVFTRLTIGDGLVGQVPALLVSVASGLLVTRSANRVSFGHEVLGQLFGQRKAIGLSGAVLMLMAFGGVLGMPFPVAPLFVVGAICLTGWYLMGTAEAAASVAEAAQAEEEAAAGEAEPEKVEKLLHVDPMALEVGYGLVPLVDTGGGAGGLLGRVQMIRRQIATELGIIVPPVRIRDDIRLDANDYVVKIHGGVVARGVAIPDRYLAMDSGMVTETIEGIETIEPAFGLPAVWVLETQREEAERRGYTVVDAETVVATHLTEVIKNRAHEILTRDEVRRLLDTLSESSPALVQDVVPDMLNIADLQRVLQNLLRERVSIRNLDMILETMGDYARRTKDPDILTEYARNALSRHICTEYAENGNTLYVITMDPNLEAQIQQAIEHTEGGSFLTLRPADVQRIVEAISEQLNALLSAGHAALLLTSPQIRSHVKRMTEASMPILAVLSYNEVGTEYQVESMGLVRLAPPEEAGAPGAAQPGEG